MHKHLFLRRWKNRFFKMGGTNSDQFKEIRWILRSGGWIVKRIEKKKDGQLCTIVLDGKDKGFKTNLENLFEIAGYNLSTIEYNVGKDGEIHIDAKRCKTIREGYNTLKMNTYK